MRLVCLSRYMGVAIHKVINSIIIIWKTCYNEVRSKTNSRVCSKYWDLTDVNTAPCFDAYSSGDDGDGYSSGDDNNATSGTGSCWARWLFLAFGAAMLLSTAGCYNGQPITNSLIFLKVMQDAPDGPLGFKAGWRDGCHNATASTVNKFYSHYYHSYEFDNEMYNTDPDYRVGFQISMWFCGRFRELQINAGNINKPSLVF